MNQLVPKELLEKSNKILFIGGVAIGDFSYLHNYFKVLSEQYPNLKIDLWHDEYRGKGCWLRWGHKKRDIVYEWLESCSFFNKIYKNVGDWWNLPGFFKQLRREQYPIVVCLFNVRASRTEKFAKKISPSGLVIKALDTSAFDSTVEAYAYVFKRLFGIRLSDTQKKLSLQIPENWLTDVRTKLLACGVTQGQKIVFLNSFAKDPKRCWDINKIIELIRRLKLEDAFSNAVFIINAMPDKKKMIDDLVKNNLLCNVHVFSASKSFFELPALMSLCDFIASVDTSVIHLAYALDKPLVALMRQKNAYLVPPNDKTIAVFAATRTDWTESICVDAVFKGVKKQYTKAL